MLNVRTARCTKLHYRIAAAAMAAAFLLVGVAGAADAHPLGNFTINRYSRLEVLVDRLRVIYIVDMAEIPAHAERTAMDENGDGDLTPVEVDLYRRLKRVEWMGGLRLHAGAVPIELQPVESTLTFPAGQAGLPTLRMVNVYEAPLAANQLPSIHFRDDNFADRIGWQEVVVQAGAGVRLVESTAPSEDTSQALTAYPDGLLSVPLRVDEATFRIAPAGATPHATRSNQQAVAAAESNRPVDPFADLVALPDLDPWAVILALFAAFGWGAVHALSPGHGKSIVAAYLVGTRGTAKHALFLGATTTITHTAGVFALGGITLLLSRYILPEQLYPWLSTASGLLVVLIGVSLIRERVTGQGHGHQHHAHSRAHAGHGGHHHDHTHEHDGVVHSHDDAGHLHQHGQEHDHTHLPPGADGRPLTWRSLLALGISGGLLPCPSALVLMLGAISLDRVGFGLMLIVAFSLGLAGVLTLFGIVLLHAGRLFAHIPEGGRLLRLAPVGAAIFITAAGLVITVQALGEVGVM